MASIYKRGGRKNREGKYTASYFDENGKRVERSTGTSDRDAAHQIAARWETEVALKRLGIIDPALARVKDHNATPIGTHVTAYLDHCEHIGQDKVHRKNKRTQLFALVAGIRASRLADLEPNRVETYLRTLVTAGKSARTHNQHRTTAVSFAEWCVESGRMTTNTRTIVPTLNEAKDRRLVRRALTEGELARLVAVSQHRRAYYVLAAFTGLRVKAVKAIVWADVNLDAGEIRVRASNAKGKRDDVFFALHPQVVDELRRIKPHRASPWTRCSQQSRRSAPFTATANVPKLNGSMQRDASLTGTPFARPPAPAWPRQACPRS